MQYCSISSNNHNPTCDKVNILFTLHWIVQSYTQKKPHFSTTQFLSSKNCSCSTWGQVKALFTSSFHRIVRSYTQKKQHVSTPQFLSSNSYNPSITLLGVRPKYCFLQKHSSILHSEEITLQYMYTSIP